MTDFLSSLRKCLNLSADEVSACSNVSLEKLCLIESGSLEPTDPLIYFYARKLGVRFGLMSLLLKGAEHNVPGFNSFRLALLKMLNGYLKFSLRMSAFDEKSEKVSR